MFLEFLRPTDIEHLVWNYRTFGELLAFLNEVAFEDNDVLGERDEVFLLGTGIRAGYHAALGADSPANIHNPINLGNLGRILRATGFKLSPLAANRR